MKMKQGEKQATIRDPGNILCVLYVGLVMVLTAAAVLYDARTASGSEGAEEMVPEEVRQGELLFAGAGQGTYTAAPHLSQDVEIYVSGLVVRSNVRQRFVNDTDQWQEAIYVFPLPDEAAVDQLTMHIGERVIVGDIKEKREARRTYEQAKRDGKKSSLLSQERPNIFTVAVANIGPGEEVEVEIAYQDVVRLDGDVFSLRFPMVVGTRYIPGCPLPEERETGTGLSFTGTGWSQETDQVEDASRITPPVNSGTQKLNPVRLMVELAAGFPVAEIESLYHGVSVREVREKVHEIRFTGEVAADRDFVLEWTAEKQQTPHAALFSESRDKENYLLLMLTPPEAALHGEVPPRELVFILDTSGSMAGSSIVQAQKALVLAISRLHKQDRFNVIEFNSKARRLFPAAVAADSEHRKRAIGFVESLTANGGTEIAPALQLALDGRTDHDRIRQIVFLTDGCVGNEAQLLAQIHAGLGSSRLFTVGIGSAPNSYFMNRAAAMGRGSFTYIAKVDEVQEKMEKLFVKLEYPAVTDIRITDGDGSGAAVHPDPLPDLYQGEVLSVALRVPENIKSVQVSGRKAGGLWQERVGLTTAAVRPGIATLWARRRIRSLMDTLNGGADKEDVRQKVLEIALPHHLVSRYTSLVAVEQQVSRPEREKLQQSALKSNLPKGWQKNKIFGGTARTATPAAMHILLGLFLLLLSFLLSGRAKGQG